MKRQKIIDKHGRILKHNSKVLIPVTRCDQDLYEKNKNHGVYKIIANFIWNDNELKYDFEIDPGRIKALESKRGNEINNQKVWLRKYGLNMRDFCKKFVVRI